MKTIQMTIDDQLLELVDKMSRARCTTRSAFIRDALKAEIRRARIREEARHAQGYAYKPVKPDEFDIWIRHGNSVLGPSSPRRAADELR